MTTSNELKLTPTYIASELFHLSNGFAILRRMICDLREVEGDVTDEMINQLVWTADHIKAELNEAIEHAEELADDERTEVAARRSVAVLQAAE